MAPPLTSCSGVRSPVAGWREAGRGWDPVVALLSRSLGKSAAAPSGSARPARMNRGGRAPPDAARHPKGPSGCLIPLAQVVTPCDLLIGCRPAPRAARPSCPGASQPCSTAGHPPGGPPRSRTPAAMNFVSSRKSGVGNRCSLVGVSPMSKCPSAFPGARRPAGRGKLPTRPPPGTPVAIRVVRVTVTVFARPMFQRRLS
jgi:hypothetical protein